MSMNSSSIDSEFATGLGILLVAQFLSAFMGAYVEDTYAEYGSKWVESLFYSHFLCLPLFLPFGGTLRHQYAKLAATSPLDMDAILETSQEYLPMSSKTTGLLRPLGNVPQGIIALFVNSVTQLACISGVNLLSAESSAVTVTIVLNIRKLVSFIFSTILFGHHLNSKMVLGSTLVFGSGALYGWETSWRLPQQRKLQSQANGSFEKTK